MSESEPKRMGPPIKMDEEKIRQLKAILRLKPTLEDCAAFLDLNPSTIDKWIKRTHGITYSEFRDQNMVHTRFMLIRQALKKAENGDNTMLIFCLKNLCGWSDNHNINHAVIKLENLVDMSKEVAPQNVIEQEQEDELPAPTIVIEQED